MNNNQLRTIFDRFGNDPAEFRRCLFIEADGQTVRLANVLDPWQDADFKACDPGWLKCTGRLKNTEAKSRIFLQRPRGHSKTGDIAIQISWALTFAPRMIKGFAFAKDREQAKLLRDSILQLIRLNEWLGQIIEVQNYRVVVTCEGHPGRDSELQIRPSDVGGSYGILADFICCDEVSNWGSGGEYLWHSIVSSVAKKSSALLLCISNAGLIGDWQWALHEQIRESSDWLYSSLPGPVASWISPKQLDEQRRALPARVFEKLWLNQWVANDGQGLPSQAIEKCITLDGPHEGRRPHRYYIASIDTAQRGDATALVVLALNVQSRQIEVANVRNWFPKDYGGTLSMEVVKPVILRNAERFGFDQILIDPAHAGRQLLIDLAAKGLRPQVWDSAGKYQTRMATTLLDCIHDRILALYPHELLIGDLMKARIIEKSYGLKVEWPRTKNDHCDRGASLCQCLPWALDVLQGRTRLRPREVPEEIVYA